MLERKMCEISSWWVQFWYVHTLGGLFLAGAPQLGAQGPFLRFCLQVR